MYCFHHLSFIASWNLLVLPASSDNLFSLSNSNDLLWDPGSSIEPEGSTTQPTIDDFASDLEWMNFDDSVDRDSFEDDHTILFENIASQSLCAAAEASDVSLEARDGKSCQTETTGSLPILSPESVQLFQDQTTFPNDLLSPSKKEEPSGSVESQNPFDPPSYPGLLTDEEADNKDKKDLDWDLKEMGLSLSDNNFFCFSDDRKVPVCCRGPYNQLNIANCDSCKIS